MKKASRAILYSTIVFPGAGYWVLGATKRAVSVLLATLTCLSVIAFESIHKAQIISQKIIDGEIALDIMAIREQIESTPGVFSPGMITFVSVAIATFWLIGILDVYRLGRADEEIDA